MLSYTTERPVTIYRIEIICRRYKSTLKRSTQAIWCHPAKESQATHSQEPICLLPLPAHHLRHCRLLQVVALRCCMQGQHLTCQLLCLKLLRRSRRLAAAFFAPLVLLPLLKKVIFQGFSHATSIPRTRTWDDVTWSHSSAQKANVPTAKH